MAAAVDRLAVQGVDIAAGRGDLRLQAQITGHTPGAEIAHEISAFFPNGHGAFIVADTADAGIAERCADNHLGILPGDGYTGIAEVVAGHIHIEKTAAVVVIDHHRRSTQGNSVVGLLRKVQRTPGTEYDFTPQIDTGIVLHIADALDQNIFIFRAAAIGAGIQAAQQIAESLVALLHTDLHLQELMY